MPCAPVHFLDNERSLARSQGLLLQAAVGRHPDWLGFKKDGGYSRLWNQLAEQLQALPRNRACTASERLRCSPPQTRFAGADAVAGEFESSSGRRIDVDSDSWLAGSVDCVIRHAVDADKHPVAAPTVPIAATDGPVTSSTTNSGGTRHLNGTPLVPMPLVT